jgi:hypothetical protein
LFWGVCLSLDRSLDLSSIYEGEHAAFVFLWAVS